MLARDADEMVEQLALQPAGILHADGDAGQQALENARRREIEGRADLAQILRRPSPWLSGQFMQKPET